MMGIAEQFNKATGPMLREAAEANRLASMNVTRAEFEALNAKVEDLLERLKEFQEQARREVRLKELGLVRIDQVERMVNQRDRRNLAYG
jgi:hypothetical protein